jgi:hypothetical protein
MVAGLQDVWLGKNVLNFELTILNLGRAAALQGRVALLLGQETKNDNLGRIGRVYCAATAPTAASGQTRMATAPTAVLVGFSTKERGL